MARGRSLLLLTVVALALGAYIYFVEMPRDTTDPATRKDQLFSVEAAAIEELEVRASNGTTTTLKKEGDDWRITAPETLDADETQVSSILNTIESAEIQRVLDANPASVADFGLDPPRYSIAFRKAGDAQPTRLLLGQKTPTGADLYARIDGDPRLLLISGYLEDSLHKTIFDLRDKTVLKFTRDAVDTISVDAKGAPAITLTKKGEQWRLTAPVDARADFGVADSLISRLEQARMKSIVPAEAQTPADMKKYGLDAPQAQVTLGAGSTRATLAIGAKADDTSVYARDLSRPVVFTVESSLLDDVKKNPNDLRMKDVFAFRSYSALSVDLTTGGQTYAFAKEKPADQSATADVWKMKAPAGKDVDQTKFTDLLATLSNLRAERFVDKAPAGADTLTVVARSGDAASPTEDRVTFRKVGNDVYALIAGESGAAVIPTAEFDKATTAIAEIVK
jgi:hypothetical protein